MFVLANVMIPSVVGHIFVMLVLLIPIVLIEAIVLCRRHLVKYAEALSLSLRANLSSTFAGIPLGYVFAFVGVIPAGLFAMLLPERIESAVGVILGNVLAYGAIRPSELDEVGFYLGTLIVMIPYFLVTLWIERRVIAKRRKDLDAQALATTVRIMNDITYGLIALPVVVGAIRAVMRLMSKA